MTMSENTVHATPVDADLLEMMDSLFARFTADSVSPLDEMGLDPELWAALTDLGLARLTGSDESGGSGATWQEAAALLSSAAAAAVPTPIAENDLLAGWLVEAVGIGSDYSVRTAARLDGGVAVAPWARFAESVVLVRAAGAGWEVAELPVDDVEITAGKNLSGEPRDALTVPQAVGEWKAAPESTGEELLLRGALARSAQICGALESIVDLCASHTTQRTQFGRPLARFQAVQHLVADLAAESALARAATDAAVARVSTLGWSHDTSALSVAVAKSCASHAVSTVVRNAHQVHGAIGTTYEHDLHRYTNPALSWRAEYGSGRAWDGVIARAAMRGGEANVWPLVTDGVPVLDLVREIN